MGEPTTEASDRCGVATCKVDLSEPCQRNPRRSTQKHRSAAAALETGAPQNLETRVGLPQIPRKTAVGRQKTTSGDSQRPYGPWRGRCRERER